MLLLLAKIGNWDRPGHRKNVNYPKRRRRRISCGGGDDARVTGMEKHERMWVGCICLAMHIFLSLLLLTLLFVGYYREDSDSGCHYYLE
jgi:hypothetical protein